MPRTLSREVRFGFPEKQPNDVIAEAFKERLKKVAGFKYVPEPVPILKTDRRGDYGFCQGM